MQDEEPFLRDAAEMMLPIHRNDPPDASFYGTAGIQCYHPNSTISISPHKMRLGECLIEDLDVFLILGERSGGLEYRRFSKPGSKTASGMKVLGP